jgi:actin-related protein 9
MVNVVNHNGASTSRLSSLPQQSEAHATVNDYLIGAQLDEALAAGQDIAMSWPFADGDVRDWTQAEALWYVRPVLFAAQHFMISMKEARVIHSVTASTDPKRVTSPIVCNTWTFQRPLRTNMSNIL